MNPADFSNASESFKRANPDLFSPYYRETAKLECGSGDAALQPAKAQEPDSAKFLVRVVAVRTRLLDEDNLCEKYHVDCCRYSGLIPGDAPEQTHIEVSQRKAAKGEQEHVMIEIFRLQ